MTSQGYTHPDLLAETEWLEAHLDDPNIRVVDCEPFDAYRRAHIKGAVGISVHPYIKDPNRPRVMEADAFAELAGNMGLGDDNLIVTYDSGWGLSATRFWWVLNYYGHTNVKVLNGGWAKWFGEGRPVTVAAAQPERATFTPQVNADVICTLDHGVANVGKPDVVFLDVRSDGEWDGSNNRGNDRAGHIPGAVHLEWLNFLSEGEYQTLKPASELRTLLEGVGATPEKQVITY
jgi:thiosulfate/3-mercaptopyruvate sulfurtransferase